MSGVVCGSIFSLLSGQPLVILGFTGPIYVFEKILFSMCDDQGWDYLSLRLWTGLWIGFMLFVMVITDFSVYVKYITRFTEEIFAVLCAAIYIYNALHNLCKIGIDHYPAALLDTNRANNTSNGMEIDSYQNDNLLEIRQWKEDTIILMSTILFTGTIILAGSFQMFRHSKYFPGWFRHTIADFSMIISIIAMTLVDHFSGIETPKLNVPNEFKPTWEGRDWVGIHLEPDN